MSWFSAARIGEICSLGWPGVSLQQRGALGGVKLPGHPRHGGGSDGDRQPYAEAAGHVSTDETGFRAALLQRYPHLSFNNPTTGTLLPNCVRDVCINVFIRDVM